MEIIKASQLKPYIGPDNVPVYELVTMGGAPPQGGGLAEVVMAPGTSALPHLHKHTAELYYILRGTGRMTIGAETAMVGAGDVVAIPLNARHFIVNVGQDDLVLLAFCTPAWSEADSHPA